MKTSILSLLKCFRNLLHKTWIDVVRFNKNQFKWLSKYRIDTVIDIWANIWQFLWEYHKILPNAHFHSFEPLPSAFAKLKKRYGNIKNIRIYNIWLGSTKGSITMNECDYDPSSSMLEMTDIHKKAFPHTKESNEVKVELEKLDNINILWDNILVKIDTQWYEIEVVQWWIETIKNAKICIIETSFYELYKGQPLFADVYNKMIELWFVYKWAYDQLYDPLNGSILQQDMIFIKWKLA